MRIFVLVLAVYPLAAQQSRMESIQLQREEKAKSLEPDEPSPAEQRLNWAKDHQLLERITAGIGGLRLRFGGLVTGSGFAIGPEYVRRDLLDGRLRFSASAVASLRKFHRERVLVSMPNLAANHLLIEFEGNHFDYPQLNYFGPGPNSVRSGRSNYRLENTSGDLNIALKPVPVFQLGVTGGYTAFNVGPGTDSRFISSDRIYSPQVAPGIDHQSNFARAGIFMSVDTRDNPGGPKSGLFYLARYTLYSDRTWQQYSHNRLTLEAQHYFPFLNRRRVIALRGHSELTHEKNGNSVPFYLQPVVGGSETLRGFRQFRFYDDNSIVANAEYRWEIFSGLDAALFYDTGKVFAHQREWNFRHLEKSYGFGFRGNMRNDVVLRLDFGFSREGFQIWFKFSDVFGSRW